MEGAMMKPEPQSEHQWLHQLLGRWRYEADMGGSKCRGVEVVRSLGGLWVCAEGESEMPDGSSGKMIMTLGYDTAKKRFVGTWIGTMMTNLWVYDGKLDGAGRSLTLAADGPSMSGDGSTAHYQDIIEIKGPDHRVLTARVQDKDGTWRELMSAHYHRER
jgi:hypothetical protein